MYIKKVDKKIKQKKWSPFCVGQLWARSLPWSRVYMPNGILYSQMAFSTQHISIANSFWSWGQVSWIVFNCCDKTNNKQNNVKRVICRSWFQRVRLHDHHGREQSIRQGGMVLSSSWELMSLSASRRQKEKENWELSGLLKPQEINLW